MNRGEKRESLYTKRMEEYHLYFEKALEDTVGAYRGEEYSLNIWYGRIMVPGGDSLIQFE